MSNRVQLHGKCTLNFSTGTSTYKLLIPKNNRAGENNAIVLIDDVLHFAVMRMGTDQLKALVDKKIASYEGRYKEQGLFPDD